MKTNPMIAATDLAATKAVSGSATAYSDIDSQFYKTTGYAGALITVAEHGSSGTSFVITQQCSLNGKDWYDPINASSTTLGYVAYPALTAGTYYVVFEPTLTPFIRFKMVESGGHDGYISLRLFYQT